MKSRAFKNFIAFVITTAILGTTVFFPELSMNAQSLSGSTAVYFDFNDGEWPGQFTKKTGASRLSIVEETGRGYVLQKANVAENKWWYYSFNAPIDSGTVWVGFDVKATDVTWSGIYALSTVAVEKNMGNTTSSVGSQFYSDSGNIAASNWVANDWNRIDIKFEMTSGTSAVVNWWVNGVRIDSVKTITGLDSGLTGIEFGSNSGMILYDNFYAAHCVKNYTGVVAFTGASEINETNGVLPIWFNDCIDGLAIEKIIIKDASGNTFNDYTININGNRGFEIVFNGTPDEGTYTVVFDESLQGILHSNIIENIGFSISVGEGNSLTVEEKEVPKSPRINGFVLKDKEGTELNYEFEIDAENVDKAVILMNTEVAASSLQLVNLYVKTYKGWENVPVNITQTGTDIEIDLNGILNSGRQYKLRAKGGFAAAEDNAFISEIDISWNINTQKVDDSFSASFSDMAYGQIPASVEKMYSTNVTTVADSGDEHGMALFSGQGTSHTNIKLENVITEGTAHFGFDLKAKDLVWSALYILNGSNDNTIGFGNFTRSSGISFNTDFGGSVMNENTGWKTDEWNEIDIVVQMSDTNNVDMYFFVNGKLLNTRISGESLLNGLYGIRLGARDDANIGYMWIDNIYVSTYPVDLNSAAVIDKTDRLSTGGDSFKIWLNRRTDTASMTNSDICIINKVSGEAYTDYTVTPLNERCFEVTINSGIPAGDYKVCFENELKGAFPAVEFKTEYKTQGEKLYPSVDGFDVYDVSGAIVNKAFLQSEIIEKAVIKLNTPITQSSLECLTVIKESFGTTEPADVEVKLYNNDDNAAIEILFDRLTEPMSKYTIKLNGQIEAENGLLANVNEQWTFSTQKPKVLTIKPKFSSDKKTVTFEIIKTAAASGKVLLACTAYNSGGLAIGADFSLVDIGEVGLGVNSELLSIDYDGEVDVCKSFIWTYPQLKKAVIDEYGNIN